MISPALSRVLSLKSLTNCPMLTPCCPNAGPTGGAGVAWPPGHCSLTIALTSLAIGSPRGPGGAAVAEMGTADPSHWGRRSAAGGKASDRFHLPVADGHGRRTPEDVHRDLEGALVGVHVLHGRIHVLERAFLDLDAVALAEVDRHLRLLLRRVHAAEHRLDVLRPRRRRLRPRADEIAEAGRLAQREPDLVAEIHLHHEVARVQLLALDLLLAAAHLGHGLHRDDDLRDLLLQAGLLHPHEHVGADLVLATDLHAQEIP